jgi:hypothetical protein
MCSHLAVKVSNYFRSEILKMASQEIDSFVGKFKYLSHAGFKATLKIEAEHGEALVTLRAELGSIPPPFYLPRPPSQTPQAYRGPAYQQRQERQRAARTAAENVAKHVENANDPKTSDGLNVTAGDQVADGATKISTIEKINMSEAEDASEIL